MKKAYMAVYGLIAVLIVAAVIISYSGKPEEKPDNEIVKNEQVNNSKDTPYREISKEQNHQTTSASEKVSENTTQAAASDADNLKERKSNKVSENKKTQTQTEPQTAPESVAPESKEEIKTAQFEFFDNTEEMAWPVVGKVLMNYSMDTAIYDATLDQYRTNDCISISAEKGTPVCAAADGVVELVYDDETAGKSIVLNHGNGWLTTYSQLDSDISAQIGDTVNKGQQIAKVSEPTKYGSALGSHLDFKITLNNEPYDPNLVLAQFEE